jgi:hypothetical protein
MKYRKFEEAVQLFNGSKRKMAKHFDVSVQCVQYWSKVGVLPKLRAYELNDPNYTSESNDEKVGS